MSLTTNLTGGLFGPTEEEIKAMGDIAKVRAYIEGMKELEEQRQQAAMDGGLMYRKRQRSAAGGGGGGGGAPAMTREMMRFQQAGMNTASLGTPSSYNAGAGAPQPIQVIRGMTPTYTPSAGPGVGEEYLTPQHAKQGYNRSVGQGEYVSPEKEKANIEAQTPKGRLEAAQAGILEQGLKEKQATGNVETFGANLKTALPKIFDEKGGILPQFKSIYDQAANIAKTDPNKAVEYMTHGFYAHHSKGALDWLRKVAGDKVAQSITDQIKAAGNDDKAIFGIMKDIVDNYLNATSKKSFFSWGGLNQTPAPSGIAPQSAPAPPGGGGISGAPTGQLLTPNMSPLRGYTQDVERDFQKMLMTEQDPAMRNLKSIAYGPFLMGERYFQPAALEGAKLVNRVLRNIIPYASNLIDEEGFVRSPFSTGVR